MDFFFNILKFQGVLQIDAGAELWNSTDGLCGRMDGLPENDLSYNSITSFAKMACKCGLNNICEAPITEILNVSKDIIQKALEFCSMIKTDRFKYCSNKNINNHAYIEACKMDYIHCIMMNGSDCGCSSIAAYAEECFGKKQTFSWRDNNLCRK